MSCAEDPANKVKALTDAWKQLGCTEILLPEEGCKLGGKLLSGPLKKDPCPVTQIFSLFPEGRKSDLGARKYWSLFTKGK